MTRFRQLLKKSALPLGAASPGNTTMRLVCVPAATTTSQNAALNVRRTLPTTNAVDVAGPPKAGCANVHAKARIMGRGSDAPNNYLEPPAEGNAD